ncbi:hypothetical protein JVT61DRAFT_531 [Boletus reticuloceps]|uniref:Uncharacterized protein n=1 Tax=Boletus reticuloceps TaxID=495285 RepID=A0A8I2Z0T1_9AGAM|nr:hypothetical protein JVT61DRAFT_531 [Boletus reticuloceps]
MSLLARLSTTTTTTTADGGPVRPKSANRTSPYTRPSRPPKGDSDAQWSHDLYEDPDKPSLSARLSASAAAPRKPDSILVQRAIRDATATGGISIKGASTSANGNVVQVDGLVKGTSPADVEQPEGAAAAVAKFDKQPADGRILHVAIVGVQSVGLSGRLGGMDLVNENGSVDVLMGAGDDAGSKLRSDLIMNSDPRATVLVAPPGVDPKVYSQQNNSRPDVQRWQRGGRKGVRGRHGGRAGGGTPTMDVD